MKSIEIDIHISILSPTFFFSNILQSHLDFCFLEKIHSTKKKISNLSMLIVKSFFKGQNHKNFPKNCRRLRITKTKQHDPDLFTSSEKLLISFLKLSLFLFLDINVKLIILLWHEMCYQEYRSQYSSHLHHKIYQ